MLSQRVNTYPGKQSNLFRYVVRDSMLRGKEGLTIPERGLACVIVVEAVQLLQFIIKIDNRLQLRPPSYRQLEK